MDTECMSGICSAMAELTIRCRSNNLTLVNCLDTILITKEGPHPPLWSISSRNVGLRALVSASSSLAFKLIWMSVCRADAKIVCHIPNALSD